MDGKFPNFKAGPCCCKDRAAWLQRAECGEFGASWIARREPCLRAARAFVAHEVRVAPCVRNVAIGRAPDAVIVTPSSRGQERRHRSGAAAPVLAARADSG